MKAKKASAYKNAGRPESNWPCRGVLVRARVYAELLLAHGLTGDWNNIAIIDTENGSADLYAHLGNYQVLFLQYWKVGTFIP